MVSTSVQRQPKYSRQRRRGRADLAFVLLDGRKNTSARKLYGRTWAVKFGSLALKSIRQEMINLGWSRGTINQAVNVIRPIFKWAASEELIDAEVHTALCTLASLFNHYSRVDDGVEVVLDLSHSVQYCPAVSLLQGWIS